MAKEQQPEARIKERLEEQSKSLERLIAILSELRKDIGFAFGGGTVYYAVDFSEIYSYLHLDDPRVKTLGVGLAKQTYEQSARQHQIGLAHLFHTLTSTVYILPPHSLEMWAYTKSQAYKVDLMQNLLNRALERINGLDESVKELLRSLGTSEFPSEHGLREVIDLVKGGEFEQLCIDVNEIIRWNERGRTLNTLVKRQGLSYSIYDLLRKSGLSQQPLRMPTKDEEESVYENFPEERKRNTRSAKILDSRALIFLRNVNEMVEPIGAKLILVTRDLSLRKIATILRTQSWFGWNHVDEHVHGIETIFLDFILRGTSSTGEKLTWIQETEKKLESMRTSVETILQEIQDGDSRGRELTALAKAGENVLEQTSRLWDQHIKLQLSLAVSKTELLGHEFLRIGQEGEERLEDKSVGKSYQSALALLQNLWAFMSTEEYRKTAIENAKALWLEIDAECFRMIFLKHLGASGIGRIVEILSQGLQGSESLTEQRSRTSLTMPSLQFISEKYQNQLTRLQSWSEQDKQRFEKIKAAFWVTLVEATNGASEPEDFLFMAFVLGILGFWEESVEMAEKSRQIDGAISPSEVSYFLAVAKWRLAVKTSEYSKAVKWYDEAYQEILKARELDKEDPRYIKEQAVIMLFYLEATVLADRWLSVDEQLREASFEASVKRVQDLLCEALGFAKDDPIRTIDILNKLAYAESLSDFPSWAKAEEYLDQVDQIISSSNEGSVSAIQGMGPRLADTKIMLKARRGRAEKNFEVLEECIREIDRILQNTKLTDMERRIISAHLRRLREMRGASE